MLVGSPYGLDVVDYIAEYRDNSVSIATRYELDSRRIGVRIPGCYFLISSASRLAVRCPQASNRWVAGGLPPRGK
jgi:hypothetical protein